MKAFIIFLFTCVCASAQAQVNFVKNPSFEEFTQCPDNVNQIKYAKYWTDAIDTLSSIDSDKTSEFYNECANVGTDKIATTPENGIFYQKCHSGKGMIGASFYYDRTPPPPLSDDSNFREYVQGHLISKLTAGKVYCLSVWINVTDASGYAQNNIGAYLDDGSINSLPIPSSTEILTVIPQVFTNKIVDDTANWFKIEGSFVANGTETHLTIGNFFPNYATSVIPMNYWLLTDRISYYLIDDVSVIPIDLDAQAGPDTWVEQGSKCKIGRVGDTTTLGLDCKWYHKGKLIDSGAIISVNASAVKGVVDTYIVVQTICGVVKRDTVLVKTVGLGVREFGFAEQFTVFPNPSNGTFTISAGSEVAAPIKLQVFDLLGKTVYKQTHSFRDKQIQLAFHLPSGTYLLELKDEAGNVQRERICIQ